MEVQSPARVELPETLPLEVTARNTQIRTLQENKTGTCTLEPPTLTQVTTSIRACRALWCTWPVSSALFCRSRHFPVYS